MLKKLIKLTTLSLVGYYAYTKIDEKAKSFIRIKDIDTNEILEMFKDNDFKVLVREDEKVVHFIKEDKTLAVQVRLNANNEIFLVEFYQDEDGVSKLEAVYPESARIDNDKANLAYKDYKRFLGSLGLVERRFLDLAIEILEDKSLSDLVV